MADPAAGGCLSRGVLGRVGAQDPRRRPVQRKACYLALAITLDGDREVLGLWFQDTEGAKFWMQVLTELKTRGVQDILICCVDGLKGFPKRSRPCSRARPSRRASCI